MGLEYVPPTECLLLYEKLGMLTPEGFVSRESKTGAPEESWTEWDRGMCVLTGTATLPTASSHSLGVMARKREWGASHEWYLTSFNEIRFRGSGTKMRRNRSRGSGGTYSGNVRAVVVMYLYSWVMLSESGLAGSSSYGR